MTTSEEEEDESSDVSMVTVDGDVDNSADSREIVEEVVVVAEKDFDKEVEEDAEKISFSAMLRTSTSSSFLPDASVW